MAVVIAIEDASLDPSRLYVIVKLPSGERIVNMPIAALVATYLYRANLLPLPAGTKLLVTLGDPAPNLKVHLGE